MTADVTSRIRRVQASMTSSGVDALVVTPSADLRYLTGYDAPPLERLTALVLPADGDPLLVVPALEQAEAERSPGALAGMAVQVYAETDNAHAVAAHHFRGAQRIAVNDLMPARDVFALQAVLAAAELVPAGRLVADQRMHKAADEVAALRQAAAAIDRVHGRVGELLAVGRTEREVASDIAEAIIESGHRSADFVIVGSGPNGASPHHSVSDRAIEPGDAVVVDIGGTFANGYCSDSTRTYAVGREPPPEFLAYYEVLLDAQTAQCDFARPGISAEAVDRIGRSVISGAGYGHYFIHRTGHGIGLETHEAPYIVEGNEQILAPGMAFSIEPGIYLPGRHGARIEDIVVVTVEGAERLNTTSRRLSVVAG
jgi:Xaa-Pro aminopeptidase